MNKVPAIVENTYIELIYENGECNNWFFEQKEGAASWFAIIAYKD